MLRPRVSILLPCRNASATIDECVGSIVSQSLRDFEVVAIDDQSTDDTRLKLREIARQDSRFRVFCSPRPGLVPSLNFGLERATSDCIARMDADDRMHPRRLELQHRYLEDNVQVSALGSRVKVFSEDGVTEGLRAYLLWLNGCISEEAIARDIYLESPLAHPSVMFRRKAIIDAGGYREGPFPEDYDLWLRLVANGKVLSKLPQTLLEWRDSPARTSRRNPRYSREAFDRLRAEYLQQDPRLLRHRDNLVIWGAGRTTRKRVRHLLDAGFRPLAWVDIDPRKIGNLIDGVPVVDPLWLASAGRPFVLSYVAVHGARECIEGELDRLGYRKGRDYLHVG
jgi:cellulose synthase/poly-beta-1,6-N-acetylglucosamine synthase-like glycosyltransferase